MTTENRVTVSDADYIRFIQGVELQDIWLHEARVERLGSAGPSGSVGLEIETRVRWGPGEHGFLAFHGFRVHLTTADEQREEMASADAPDGVATLEAEFALLYASEMAATEELFDRFQEVNLPVNSWPYLREFVSTTLARMGLNTIFIPAFKVTSSGPTGELPRIDGHSKPESADPELHR